MKIDKKLGLVLILVVLALVSVGTVAAFTIRFPDLSGLKDMLSIKVIVNTVIIGAAAYFALPYLGQKELSKQGMTAALIIIAVVSITLAVSIGPDHFIWEKETFAGIKNLLFGGGDSGKPGILTYPTIALFIGGAALFHWFFTFLGVGKENTKINTILAIIIAANLAREGISGDKLLQVGEVFATIILYNNLQATVKNKVLAFITAFGIVEYVMYIFSGKGLILGVFKDMFGGFSWIIIAPLALVILLLVWGAGAEKRENMRVARGFKNTMNFLKYHLREKFPKIRKVWDAREDWLEGDMTKIETRNMADVELMRGLQNEFHLYQRDQTNLGKLHEFIVKVNPNLGEYAKWMDFGGSWGVIRNHCKAMFDYYKFGYDEVNDKDVPEEIRKALGLREGEVVKGADLLTIEAQKVNAQIDDLALEQAARRTLIKYQEIWKEKLRAVIDPSELSGNEKDIYDEIMLVLNNYGVDSNVETLEMGINELTQRQSYLETRKKTFKEESVAWKDLEKKYEAYMAKLDEIDAEMNPREFDQFYYFEKKYRGLDPRYFMKYTINDMDRLRKDVLYGQLHKFSLSIKDYRDGWEKYKTDNWVTNRGWANKPPMDTNPAYDRRYDDDKYVLSSELIQSAITGISPESIGEGKPKFRTLKRAKEFDPPLVNVPVVIDLIKQSNKASKDGNEAEAIKLKRKADLLIECSDPGMKYSRLTNDPNKKGKWKTIDEDPDYMNGGFGYSDGRDGVKSIWGISDFVRLKVKTQVLKREQQKKIIEELGVKELPPSKKGEILGGWKEE